MSRAPRKHLPSRIFALEHYLLRHRHRKKCRSHYMVQLDMDIVRARARGVVVSLPLHTDGARFWRRNLPHYNSVNPSHVLDALCILAYSAAQRQTKQTLEPIRDAVHK